MRGIATKIAAFYLRDVIWAFEIDESDLEPPYFQPIDVWTRRGAQALGPVVDEPPPRTDTQAAELLVRIAAKTGVRPSVVNTGVWVFGAQLVGDAGLFTRALTRGDQGARGPRSRDRVVAKGIVRLTGELTIAFRWLRSSGV